MHATAEFGIALQGDKVKARLLVIADGATSRLATKLGYCTEPPRGVCSRAFVEGGTHNTDFDGMSQHAKAAFFAVHAKICQLSFWCLCKHCFWSLLSTSCRA